MMTRHTIIGAIIIVAITMTDQRMIQTQISPSHFNDERQTMTVMMTVSSVDCDSSNDDYSSNGTVAH
jgi:hypothetical protein